MVPIPPRLARKRPLPPGVVADAVWAGHTFELDGQQVRSDRLRLRWWFEADLFAGDGVDRFAVIGLNPSAASEESSDNTLTRCWGFALSAGHRRLAMYNLFGARGTDPEYLLTYDGVPDNVAYVVGEAQRVHAAGGVVVSAWGDLPSGEELPPLARRELRAVVADRADLMLSALREARVPLHALALTADGKRPRHPLMLPATCRPTLWRTP